MDSSESDCDAREEQEEKEEQQEREERDARWVDSLVPPNIR